MIIDSNQVSFAKMSGCGLQKEIYGDEVYQSYFTIGRGALKYPRSLTSIRREIVKNLELVMDLRGFFLRSHRNLCKQKGRTISGEPIA